MHFDPARIPAVYRNAIAVAHGPAAAIVDFAFASGFPSACLPLRLLSTQNSFLYRSSPNKRFRLSSVPYGFDAMSSHHFDANMIANLTTPMMFPALLRPQPLVRPKQAGKQQESPKPGEASGESDDHITQNEGCRSISPSRAAFLRPLKQAISFSHTRDNLDHGDDAVCTKNSQVFDGFSIFRRPRAHETTKEIELNHNTHKACLSDTDTIRERITNRFAFFNVVAAIIGPNYVPAHNVDFNLQTRVVGHCIIFYGLEAEAESNLLQQERQECTIKTRLTSASLWVQEVAAPNITDEIGLNVTHNLYRRFLNAGTAHIDILMNINGTVDWHAVPLGMVHKWLDTGVIPTASSLSTGIQMLTLNPQYSSIEKLTPLISTALTHYTNKDTTNPKWYKVTNTISTLAYDLTQEEEEKTLATLTSSTATRATKLSTLIITTNTMIPPTDCYLDHPDLLPADHRRRGRLLEKAAHHIFSDACA
ncbi:hypothetical protein CkaCkLH20_13040 [Colletotrichum karsti]|uniref:Uncharacterized protein n=1 Tax=Colletotrichum karsti TaxID=1095194 RepID=A0A9P6HS11_9PEZI|nr:uncharacterized protein CkaCkLH20_13040 [Colletotrichum karsti]KAF9869502.1 hypothetical protein CkaCkLH20_13040 [Colletotrichum karsti]